MAAARLQLVHKRNRHQSSVEHEMIVYVDLYHKSFVECVSHGVVYFLVDITIRLTQILYKHWNRTFATILVINTQYY